MEMQQREQGVQMKKTSINIRKYNYGKEWVQLKRKVAVCIVCLLVFNVIFALADSGWYCPKCGRYNEYGFEFCPVDGTAKPLNLNNNTSSNQSAYTQYAYITKVANQRIASRTGPGTQYDEPGSFNQSGESYPILSKAYDSRNEIWWVQIELTNRGNTYWLYTGVKRFNDLDLDQIPEEKVIGHCTTSMRIEAYYGPGPQYARISSDVPSGVDCDIYGYVEGSESDYIQIEFYDKSQGLYRRAWVQDPFVDNYEMYYGF